MMRTGLDELGGKSPWELDVMRTGDEWVRGQSSQFALDSRNDS